jgi:hypothetical protein
MSAKFYQSLYSKNIELLDENLKSITSAFDKILSITSEKVNEVNKLINLYKLPNTVT